MCYLVFAHEIARNVGSIPVDLGSSWGLGFRLRVGNFRLLANTYRTKPFSRQAIQESQQSVEHGERVRWTPRDIEVDVNSRWNAVGNLWTAAEGTAGDRARSHRDNEFGRGGSLERLLKSDPHVAVDRTGDNHAVSMPWRRDELNAESTEIEHDVPERGQFGFASSAAASHQRAQPERPAKETPRSLVERTCQLHFTCRSNEAGSCRARHTVITREGDSTGGAVRTGFFGTEEARSHIERWSTRLRRGEQGRRRQVRG